MSKLKKIEALSNVIDIMDILRKECPWDRKQTMESLRRLTVEETFELTDAIVDNDFDEIKKELGDLLLHIVFYSKICEEKNQFDLGDVSNSLVDKLKYRHPHIFGDTKCSSSKEVEKNWEILKLKEKGRSKKVLEGVPRSLPALIKACRVQEKVAAVGFDWEERADVWDKVKEEVSEVEAEIESKNQEKLEAEFGDLMFSIINAARLYNVDPEMALEKTNKKFISRFEYIENCSAKSDRAVNELSLDEMNTLWEEAKKK